VTADGGDDVAMDHAYDDGSWRLAAATT